MQSILGISIGTWEMGYAVISYNDLIRWKIHSFPGAWNVKKAGRIEHRIQQYIDRHNVKAIAVKIPEQITHLSEGIKKIIGIINVLAEDRKLEIHYYTLTDLKRFHSPELYINKKVLIDCILRSYPNLHCIYRKERFNKRKYHFKTFEAVACAHVCYKEQFDNKSKH